MSNIYAIIMAGGEGTRFYPLSTPDRPKQFLNFIGDRSFIRQTFERILPLVPVQNIYVSTNEKYVGLVREHLPELPQENILAEPAKKNTAPALTYAALKVAARDGNAVMCCLPSDHYIEDEPLFRDIMAAAIKVASDGSLVTLGMKPSWASTDYGYIKISISGESMDPLSPCGRGLGRGGAFSAHPVLSFTEKPNAALAAEYFSSGNYLWNGGIFIWRADTFLNEMKTHAPELFPVNVPSTSSANTSFPSLSMGEGASKESTSFPSSLMGEGQGEGDLSIHSYFNSVPSISIDYALMEKSDKVVVIPADIGWSDVGGWEAVERLASSGVKISKSVLVCHPCALLAGTP